MHSESFRLDDLRVFLAVLRTENATRAARLLRTDQSTVSRRLAALEEALGVALFDRTSKGLRATDAARAIVVYAEQVESAAEDIRRVLLGWESEPEGLVRLSMPPEIANELIAPRLGALFQQAPKLSIELIGGAGVVDLTRREADIAICAVRPQSGVDLIVTRIADIEYRVFASRSHLASRGAVRTARDLAWIGWDESLAMIPEAQWLTRLGVSRFVVRANSVGAHRRAAAGGAGAALIARAVAVLEPNLVEVPIGEHAPMILPVFMVGHRASRQVPRVRVVWEFLAKLLAETFARGAPARGRARSRKANSALE